MSDKLGEEFFDLIGLDERPWRRDVKAGTCKGEKVIDRVGAVDLASMVAELVVRRRFWITSVKLFLDKRTRGYQLEAVLTDRQKGEEPVSICHAVSLHWLVTGSCWRVLGYRNPDVEIAAGETCRMFSLNMNSRQPRKSVRQPQILCFNLEFGVFSFE